MFNVFLEKLIDAESTENNVEGNETALTMLTDFLTNMHFKVSVQGKDFTNQPVIVAHRKGFKSDRKILIYGHYDVATVNKERQWLSQNPFQLELINGRYFGRGIADNKGPLSARLFAVKSLIDAHAPCPEILWLIQGEEEVHRAEPVANSVFAKAIANFGCKVVVDETGFNDIDSDEQIAFLWSPGLHFDTLTNYQKLISACLGEVRFECRHLNKLMGISSCPLLRNISHDTVYIGFGPNDKLHNIHKNNESLAVDKLSKHQQQFELFLTSYATSSLLENYS
ncbi:hypothetical protein WG68_04490 [Arsukibacterium ikkense]|uniref:Peptidase M20 n=1 Tax=Arsukibacterium ikkense TaxID=336831 RepID=A0A0M2V7G4_9GAMM|nr:M20/M25/M40 family metallo-hydrolase [Arsukibacterium ikkense]KKO46566.1 hypothetical protein WG68_04490 [Arsukibacterium ikkense]